MKLHLLASVALLSAAGVVSAQGHYNGLRNRFNEESENENEDYWRGYGNRDWGRSGRAAANRARRYGQNAGKRAARIGQEAGHYGQNAGQRAARIGQQAGQDARNYSHGYSHRYGYGPGGPYSDESEDYDSADYEDDSQDYDWEDGDEYSEDEDSLEDFDLVEAERRPRGRRCFDHRGRRVRCGGGPHRPSGGRRCCRRNRNGHTVCRRCDADSEKGWRSDLPWDKLGNKLLDPSSLIHAGIDQYLEECVPQFDDYSCFDGNRTNWGLIDQPSGLCMDSLFCAFEDCDPKPNSAEYALGERIDSLVSALQNDCSPGGTYPDEYKVWIQDPSNPNGNLPGKVLHPRTASDVIAAIAFAKEYGLEISVKNSGHSWTGSSTKANSLLLNMRRYTKYAPEGITDCDDQAADQGLGDQLRGQPCLLSTAKGKSGVVRVSGGENFGELYLVVNDYNMKSNPDHVKYHVVGGDAGTVSPNGWTFEGGLSGSTGGRMFGHGVDQVLQIEMVLAEPWRENILQFLLWLVRLPK